jgi:hypothetical protein
MAANSWPNEDAKKLKDLWAEGISVPRIRKHFGNRYSERSIYNKAHNLRLPKRVHQVIRKKIKPATAPAAPENMVAKDIQRQEGEPRPIGPIGDFPRQPACRWPYGDTRTSSWQMCAHPIDAPSPYCSAHRARAWTKPHNLTVRPK